MAAFVVSVEKIQTTFPNLNTLQTNTVNLGKSQDEAQCVPMSWSQRFTTASSTDRRNNNTISIEMIDNSGTPAARIRRHGNGTAGAVTVEITIVEFGSNVTVQQNSTAIVLATGTLTENITAVGALNRAFVIFNYHPTDTSNSDDWNDFLIQVDFNSTSQLRFDRRAAGAPDWDIFYYVVESDGTDFLTEYFEFSWAAADAGPAGHTLSNTVTLNAAFLVCSYENSEGADDMADAIANFALTGVTTLTWYRDHGGTPNSTGTFGVWIVRASSTELFVQRFATDVDGQLTTNQSITTVDDDKALVMLNSNMAGSWAIDSTLIGSTDISDRQTTVHLQATNNVRLQRHSDTAIDGSNNKIRFEVIEFELEGAAAADIPNEILEVDQAINRAAAF